MSRRKKDHDDTKDLPDLRRIASPRSDRPRAMSVALALHAPAEVKALEALEEDDEYIVHHTGKSWFQKMAPVTRFMNTWTYNVPMLVATVFALFSEDIRYAVLPTSADLAWDIITFICFLLFSLDVFLSSIAQKKYFFRVYFWLDLLATLSLVTAVGFLGTGSLTANLSVARAGRAARAGTRSGRLVRVFKLFKLTRKSSDEVDENIDKGKQVPPSVVGTRLTDRTTMKVVIGVMLMIALIPLLDYNVSDRSFDYSLRELSASYVKPSDPNRAAWDSNQLAFFDKFFSDDVLELVIDSEVILQHQTTLDELRLLEKQEFTDSLSGHFASMVIDQRRTVRISSAYNIATTVFVVLLLSIGNFLFQRDSRLLVIKPIERMTEFVKTLANNPLHADGIVRRKKNKKKKKKRANETDILEQSLEKIAALMQIGFGEAGANLISKNLSSGGALNALVPGQKMEGIFGFCDIRQFTDTTECLLENVMPFVNTIAQIVHNATVDNYGAPNKNIGDAFLLAWRIPDDAELDSAISDIDPRQVDLSVVDKRRFVINRYADGALRSFVRIINEINTDPDLEQLCRNRALQDRIPHYKVKMGFGLHIGWGIEGAIGSSHKVDASYLSPHVNLAARLESATKQYGKFILCSEAFVQALSPEVAHDLRRLDRVTVKGSKEPMVLYTYDYTVPDENTGAFTTYESYKKLFHSGYDLYIAGKWGKAAEIFEKCLVQWPSDEPAKLLLWFMSRYNFNKPSDWKGFRELNEK